MADRGMRVLVAWYGIYQAGHLVFNIGYLLDPGSPPLPAPVDGWSPQLTDFLYGMVLADTVNAALALGFVYGYFARLRGHAWLGTLTLTVSIYAAVVFTYGTLAVGAWIGHLADYLAFYLPFIPVIVLFAWWCTRRARDR